MQIEAYTAEVIKLEEYVEHAWDPRMQTFWTHQRNTNLTLFQTATNFRKYPLSHKAIKNTIVRKIKESKKAAWSNSTCLG
jgi:hypothetical protein